MHQVFPSCKNHKYKRKGVGNYVMYPQNGSCKLMDTAELYNGYKTATARRTKSLNTYTQWHAVVVGDGVTGTQSNDVKIRSNLLHSQIPSHNLYRVVHIVWREFEPVRLVRKPCHAHYGLHHKGSFLCSFKCKCCRIPNMLIQDRKVLSLRKNSSRTQVPRWMHGGSTFRSRCSQRLAQTSISKVRQKTLDLEKENP